MNNNNDITPIRIKTSDEVRTNAYNADDDRRHAHDTRTPNKDFKKVLSRTDEDDTSKKAGEEGVEETDEDGNKKPKSLFDINTPQKPMSSAQTAQAGLGNAALRKILMDQAAPTQASVRKEKGEVKESPSNLFSKMSKTSGKEKSSILSEENAIAAERDVSSKGNEDASTDAGAGGSSLYAAEQGDLSYVNPLAATAGIASAQVDGKFESKQISRTDMQSIIDQLVTKVTVMEVKGQSVTTVELKQPPMFEGATISVTSFDSAAKQFNISFGNLTQMAQNVINNNKESLLRALNEKGYTVQMFQPTTALGNVVAVEAPKAAEDRQRQNDDQPKERNPRQRG